MKNITLILFFLFGGISSAFAQLIGFEDGVPETFKVSGKGDAKVSSLFYKEGENNGIFTPVLHWMSKSIRCL